MQSIGLIGGTGDLGTALAVQLSKTHEIVKIGSRSLEKARITVDRILEEKVENKHLRSRLKAGLNREVVSSCDCVILTLPYESSVQTIRDLLPDFRGNQLFISGVAVLSKVGNRFISTRSSQSIASQVKSILPLGVEVASTFQTLPATLLYEEKEISADVLVTAESVQTYDKVAQMISSMKGLRPLYLGDLSLAGELEGLTAMLLNLAKMNKLKSPTLKINSF